MTYGYQRIQRHLQRLRVFYWGCLLAQLCAWARIFVLLGEEGASWCLVWALPLAMGATAFTLLAYLETTERRWFEYLFYEE